MSFRYTLTITPKPGDIKKAFQRFRVLIEKRVQEAVFDLGRDLVATAKSSFLSGPRPKRLGVGTGNLRASIRFAVKETGSKLLLSFGTNVPYARIHEEGGRIPARLIVPRRKKALRFRDGGQFRFARSVWFPGATIPKRPFLAPSVARELPLFKKSLAASIVKLGGSFA